MTDSTSDSDKSVSLGRDAHALTVHDLSVEYSTSVGRSIAVNDVSFAVTRGSILGLVGETGSGKSTIARTVLGILPTGGEVTEGAIWINDQNIVELRGKELRKFRAKIGFVGQMPFGSLHPILTIGEQFFDITRSHARVSRKQSDILAMDLFESVGLPKGKGFLKKRVHELSGGMAQRVVIAFALNNSPSLIVADEPTTALDVTIQKQILNLLKSLVREREIGLLLITHDLSVVGEYCNQIVVLKDGQVVESGRTASVFKYPQHSYTRVLMEEARRDLLATSLLGTHSNGGAENEV